jgi:hypothetical protein
VKQRYASPAYLAVGSDITRTGSGAYGRWREVQERCAAFKAALRAEYRLQQRAQREEWEASRKKLRTPHTSIDQALWEGLDLPQDVGDVLTMKGRVGGKSCAK